MRVSLVPLVLMRSEVPAWSSVLSNHSISRNSLEIQFLRPTSQLLNQILRVGAAVLVFLTEV